MIFEKKYWSTGEFTRKNGSDYTGYVGVYKKEAYIYDTEEKLVKNSNYKTQINTSKYFFDRVLDEELALPYSKRIFYSAPTTSLTKRRSRRRLTSCRKTTIIFSSPLLSAIP